MIDPVQEMMNGNIRFLDSLWRQEWQSVANRIKKSTLYEEIVTNCYSKLIHNGYSEFLFRLVYDNNNYKDFVTSYSLKNPKLLQDKNIVVGILSTDYGFEFLLNNKGLINNRDYLLDLLVSCALISEDRIIALLNCSDFHIRALMIKAIIRNKPAEFYDYIPNIFELIQRECDENGQYFIEPERMGVSDLSLIAVLLCKLDCFRDLYEELKQYIFANYNKNELAKYLVYEKEMDEFISDADRLFITSKTFQVEIARSYSQYINEEIMNAFMSVYGVYMSGASIVTSYAFAYDLGDKLRMITEKYLDMSEDKTFKSLSPGGCAKAFQLGDYVLKMGLRKRSYEDVICPDMFLVAKNLEEIILRDENKHVKFALEVQSLLSRTIDELDPKYFEIFNNELANQGYYSADTRRFPNWIKNCRMLNDYHDADCVDPLVLPDWFKDKPIVLIDRDLVFKLSNKNPRMLISPWEL